MDWDSERDPEIAALAAKHDPPPLHRMDPESLRRSIQERAAPILERRRRRVAWGRWAGPAGAGLTVALAASLAAVLLDRPEEPPPSAAANSMAGLRPEVLVTADLPEDEFRALVSSTEARALLLLAVENP